MPQLRGEAWHHAQRNRAAKREVEKRELESFRCTCGHRAIDHPDSRIAQLQTFPCSVCNCTKFKEARKARGKP